MCSTVFFVVCVSNKKPHVNPMLFCLDPEREAGSSLTEAGFASIDAAFPGGARGLRIHQNDSPPFVRKNLGNP